MRGTQALTNRESGTGGPGEKLLFNNVTALIAPVSQITGPVQLIGANRGPL